MTNISLDQVRSQGAEPRVTGFTTAREEIDGVSCEVVTDDDVWGTAQSSLGNRPVILYLHGGGYISGSAENSRGVTVLLARLTGAAVVVPDYRLAPEHPVPAAFADCLAVYKHLARDATQPVALAGDSAGGSLAVSLAIAAADCGLPAPVALVINTPYADMSGMRQLHTNSQHPSERLPLDKLAWMSQMALLGSELDGADYRISPIYAELSGVPRMLVQISGRDPVRNDGVLLVDRARAAGVEATLSEYQVADHAWIVRGTNPFDPEALAAIIECGMFLRRASKAFDCRILQLVETLLDGR